MAPIAEERPNAAKFRAELERVIGSQTFVASPRLASFLRYVVERTLAGGSDRLKGYTIGVEALGRPASFDPQADPIVRVEAVRLRRALARYYIEEGAGDPVSIKLEPGSYVPVFGYRPVQTNAVDSAAWRRIIQLLLQPASAAAATFVKRTVTCAMGVAGIAAVILLPLPSSIKPAPDLTEKSGGSAGAALEVPHAMSFLPIVLVEPFDASGSALSSAISPADLRRKMRDALARFDEIAVVADPLIGSATPSFAAQRGGYSGRVDYRVSGILEYHGDETVSPTLRLIDVSTGTIVWTRTFERTHLDANLGEYQESLVRRTVMTIAQENGVIQTRERIRRAAGAAVDPRYSCLLDYNHYRLNYDPDERKHVKACLTQIVARYPDFALGFAALARVSLRQFYIGVGNAESETQLVNRALRLALQATEIDSESPIAHLVLMAVHIARHDIEAAQQAAEKAIALNPYDMRIRADYGFALLRAGRIEKATALLRDAARYGYLPTPQISYAMSLTAYLAGDWDAAKRHLDSIASDSFPLGLSAQALVAAKLGDIDLMQWAIRQLIAVQPNWANDPRQELTKVFASRDIVDRLTHDLMAIGVGVTR